MFEEQSQIEFYESICKKSILDSVDQFTSIVSFYGIIELNRRVKMLEIDKKKNKEQLKNEYIENV